MESADIIRNAHRHVESPVTPDRDLRQVIRLRRETIPAHAIADRGLPDEIELRASGQAARLQPRAGPNGTLRRRKRHRGICHRDLRRRNRLALIRLGHRGWNRRTAGRRAERELRTGKVRDRRLLVVQVRLPLVAGVDLDRMIAGRPRRAKPRHRRTLRPGSRDPPDRVVVPVDRPGALHRPPPESLDPQFDQRPDRAGRGRHLEALRDLDPVLRNGTAVDDHDHVVHAAVVFRNDELRVEASVLIDREAPKRGRGRPSTSCRGSGSSPR